MRFPYSLVSNSLSLGGRLTNAYFLEWREPFIPPSIGESISVRAISYAGEEHPATAKRVIVVPVSRLPLSPSAIHAFKLIAGPRWSPRPPSDSGLSGEDDEASHGYVKLSCENFPRPAMNLKWLSDTLDKMIAAAHVCFSSWFLYYPRDWTRILLSGKPK